MRIGDIEVLVQTVPIAGTEETSAGQKVLDAYDKAQEVIIGAATSTLEVITQLAQQAARPDRLEVEFGLGFSLKGNVIVVTGQADATLKIKLTYDTPKTTP
jgi:threonine dehydratase